MKIFLTGGTGFIGSHIAKQLRDRGDDVRALARSAEKGRDLEALGCEIVLGDLGDDAAIASGMEGCDAVIHGAAVYEVGIPASEHEAMRKANVEGTERVLRTALEKKIPKVVYISTVAVFGNTHGEVVDETFEADGKSFTSFYEQTKYEAHQIAKRLVDQGLPLVIVQPGGVYGPGDHSELMNMTKMVLAGKMPMVPFPDFGMVIVHVEDVAAGVLLALDKGEVGESYVIGADCATNRQLVETVAELSGKKAPKRAMPTAMIKAVAPFGRVAGPIMGYPPNMRELISSADGVTFWARSDKAKQKLGYEPRPLRTTIADTLREMGKLKGA
jgi:nucleoside-diphosphate-sugar epimerase